MQKFLTNMLLVLTIMALLLFFSPLSTMLDFWEPADLAIEAIEPDSKSEPIGEPASDIQDATEETVSPDSMAP